MGLWRADDYKLTRIKPTAIAMEALLESCVESDPSILGEDLLIIGRKVRIADREEIDLLALDETGAGRVIELKRGKTIRYVTTQVLGYGAWVETLGRAEFISIFAVYRPGVTLEEAFYDQFGRALPEDINTTHVLTIVAAAVDSRTKRILRYVEGRGNPIEIVLVEQYVDNGVTYFTGAGLAERDSQMDTTTRKKPRDPLYSKAPRPLEELIALSAARDRVDRRIRACVDELRADPRIPSSWESIADAIGSSSASAAREAYGARLAPRDEKVLLFWKAFAGRFFWDFLPGRFLYALYMVWMGTEFPGSRPLSKGKFMRRLVAAATESGEWFHTRSRPGSLMNAVEPLATRLPGWRHEGSNEATYGLRRYQPRGSSGTAETSQR